tara:strand:- start:261 stop:518 length:258 start_codon:yes stop_codon:yes gene_type:complete
MTTDKKNLERLYEAVSQDDPDKIIADKMKQLNLDFHELAAELFESGENGGFEDIVAMANDIDQYLTGIDHILSVPMASEFQRTLT